MALAIESRAVLRLSLSTRLPASAMADIIRTTDQVYNANVWLIAESQSSLGSSLPRLATFAATDSDALLINRAEIGTPNFAELIGLTQPLLQTSSVIGAALGLGKVAVSILQSWADARKTLAEIERIRAETAKLQLETSNLPRFTERATQSAVPADKAQLDRLERMMIAVSDKLLRPYVEGVSVIAVAAESAHETLYGERNTVPAAELFGSHSEVHDHTLSYDKRIRSVG